MADADDGYGLQSNSDSDDGGIICAAGDDEVDAQSPGYAASFLIPMADAESTPPQAVFGNVSFFDKTFDDHFRVNSSLIDDALHHGKGRSPDANVRCEPLPRLKSDPEAWGMKVRVLKIFWDYIRADVEGYAASHLLNEDTGDHICVVEPCSWCHTAVPRLVSKCTGKRTPLQPNVNLVLDRYVKPLTEGHGVGAAFLLNAAKIATVKNTRVEHLCFARVFVSHYSGELFASFCRTLFHMLDEETVVWVAGFATCPHNPPAYSLNALGQCHFAVALKAATHVVAVTDLSAEVFTRCWCVLEASLAAKMHKPYDLALPDERTLRSPTDRLTSVVRDIDIAHCVATRRADKANIVQFSKSCGGSHAMNEEVRLGATNALRRADLGGVVAVGGLDRLSSFSDDELLDWRDINGSTATHIAAARNRVGAMVEILRRTANSHLDEANMDGDTPLSSATISGAFASVLALLGLKAATDAARNLGMTPLHYAAAGGDHKTCRVLLQHDCDSEAQGDFHEQQGFTPMHVAAEMGHVSIVRVLSVHGAQVNAVSSVGMMPLHRTAIRGHADAAIALLTANARVDCIEQPQGRTALMFACRFGRSTMATVLLGAQADLSIKSTRGYHAGYYIDKLSAEDPDEAAELRSLLFVEKEAADEL